MRIGVNALYLIPGGVGGTEIYLRSLLTALAEIDHHNDYFVFTNRETAADLVPVQANFTHVPQAVRAVNRPFRILWEQTVLPLAVVRRRLDVLFNPGFTAPILCSCPQVTVFHDLQHKRHPEYFRWFDLPFWNFFLFWSITVSRQIIAVSGATAEDLRYWYRLPPDKIRTVPSGVDPRFFELAAGRRAEPFLLAVSTLHPHKNLDGLMLAFAAFRKRHPEYRLVVSGIHGFFRQNCMPCATGLIWRTAWIFRVGFRGKSCTTCTRALRRFSIRACSRASGCRFWRRSPPVCLPAAHRSNPWIASRATQPSNSTRATISQLQK